MYQLHGRLVLDIVGWLIILWPQYTGVLQVLWKFRTAVKKMVLPHISLLTFVDIVVVVNDDSVAVNILFSLWSP